MMIDPGTHLYLHQARQHERDRKLEHHLALRERSDAYSHRSTRRSDDLPAAESPRTLLATWTDGVRRVAERHTGCASGYTASQGMTHEVGQRQTDSAEGHYAAQQHPGQCQPLDGGQRGRACGDRDRREGHHDACGVDQQPFGQRDQEHQSNDRGEAPLVPTLGVALPIVLTS